MAAEVIAVCVSEKRTEPKLNVGQAELRSGWGLMGDSHAGPPEPGRWEVSLLAWEDVQALNEREGLSAVPGSFAENLTTEGLDTSRLRVGDRLRVGEEVVLQVEHLGKPVEITHAYAFQGHSLLPTEGIFCGVVLGGTVSVGDAIEVVPGA
jgi:MOSC domain-containing protein YiiM